MTRHVSPPRPPASPVSTLKWYLAFGALHELSHVAIAALIGLIDFENFRGLSRLVVIFIERRWQMTVVSAVCDASIEWEIALVRHIGWVVSVVIAVAVYVHSLKKEKSGSPLGYCYDTPIVRAAAITAIEALSTDLLGLERYLIPLFPMPISGTTIESNAGDGCVKLVTFFCGNFGLILLNPAYSATGNGRKTALDILEKMISVTMVRGAQSGKDISREESLFWLSRAEISFFAVL